MAFVYEKIRDEDKEWVDFEKFKGIWREGGPFYKWSVDREKSIGLVAIDSSGRADEEEYVFSAYGLYYRGEYLNWRLKYSRFKADDGKCYEKWFEPTCNIPESLRSETEFIKQVFKESFLTYQEVDTVKRNLIIDF